MTNNYYKQWVNFNECEPEVSACLVLGINPEKKLINSRLTQFQRMKGAPLYHVIESPEVEKLARLLRNNPRHSYKLNLFQHIDYALMCSQKISNVLMKHLTSFFLNLSKGDQEEFKKNYPYVGELIDPGFVSTSDLELLHQTEAYKKINTLALDAVKKFSTYQMGSNKHKKLTKEDIKSWIKENITTKTRYIEYIKDILSEIFLK
ncbi:MAG: hypothetical protein QM652_02840 [Legionella sp.]|uniref:hypothetical protein n=1 Tax=Legionella sp. TaxID=459 RepID=UPI0039E276BF